jgi:hypothetical protein
MILSTLYSPVITEYEYKVIFMMNDKKNISHAQKSTMDYDFHDEKIITNCT